MRATIYHGKGDVRIEDVPDPSIQAPTDAIVRITDAGICGSDIWFYRGYEDWQPGWRIGHEFIGVVEDVGSAVTTVRRGDTVIAPFSFSDGTCEFCRAGLQTSCPHGGFWGRDNDGGQAEAARVPFADATLVQVPEAVATTPALRKAALPLTDVMATGHHAARMARVGPGATAVVVGDGAVGLCGVLAAKRLGAERIVAVGHHADRLAIARRFGATDVVDSHADDAAEQLLELTAGGAPSVLEAVGTQQSMDLAIAVVRPGGAVGFVGAPQEVKGLSAWPIFVKNISLNGGVAPARAYIPELLADVAAGTLDPSPVLDHECDLAGVPDAYREMNERRAVKAHVRV
ncbi:MAG: zinc-dependent alcohol dehydrogenase family protein [Thermoleophilia bacterium]